METIFRFIKHCDDCEKWPKDHWKKKKYYFQAATTMSKLMKAPKLSAWSMINAVGSPLTSLLLLLPLDISRGSHPCKHTALPPPARRSRQHERAGKRRAPMQKIQLGTGKSSINSVANTFPNHQLHYLNAPKNIWFRNAKTIYEHHYLELRALIFFLILFCLSRLLRSKNVATIIAIQARTP